MCFTRWRSWFRLYATSRKGAGSILMVSLKFFIERNEYQAKVAGAFGWKICHLRVYWNLGTSTSRNLRPVQGLLYVSLDDTQLCFLLVKQGLNKSADTINLRLLFEPQNVPDGNTFWHFKFLNAGNFVHLIFTEIWGQCFTLDVTAWPTHVKLVVVQ